MLSEPNAIFDAALALPISARADLAARLLSSLEESDDMVPPPRHTPAEWERIILERSDELHRGEAELIDGEVAIAMLREIVDKAAGRK